MEINIYHVLERGLVPTVLKLLEKIYLSQQRCLFFSPVSERVDALDKALWTFSTNAFIPHGSLKTGFAKMHPIYFTDKYENPNDAKVLLMVDSFDYLSFNENFDRIMIVFEGAEQSSEINALCESMKNSSDYVSYWLQTETKEWKKVII